MSDSYIQTSILALRQFGADVERVSSHRIVVKSKPLDPPDEYCVEGDVSTAAYDVAYSAIYGRPVELTNVPSNSMQGESEFVHILARHFKGFTLEQREHGLRVQGLPLADVYELDTDDISMRDASDSFIALCIVLGVKLAKGTTTRITGIGNQRVKECNRIQKCVEILAAFRILAYELDDGIAVVSNPTVLAMTGNTIEVPTYDDHRLAMAFAVLGSTLATNNSVVIKDAKTVDKTFPDFWRHIEHHYGISYTWHSHRKADINPTSATDGSLLVLVGMRNAGKSMYSDHIARTDGYVEYCMDAMFADTFGPIADFVTTNGWDEFRSREAQLFIDTLFKGKSAATL